jgi:hypothetical protein
MSMAATTARRKPDNSLQRRAASQLVRLLSSITGTPLTEGPWPTEEARAGRDRQSLSRYSEPRAVAAQDRSRMDVAFHPEIVVPAPPGNRARIAELEQVVWEQTLALVARCTQLADLCNKHQQQKDELDLAFNEIMRLERLEAEARREAGTIEQQAQVRIKELQDQLEAERGKLGEARSACTQLKKKLLDAETKLNDAHVLAVIASERNAASDQALKRASEEGARLRAEADARSKAHRIEVDGLRSFHIACLDQIRRPGAR